MRLQVLEAKTSELTGRKVTVQEADLLRLEGADREAAIFAFTSGAEYPLVIVDGVLACTGSLDIDSIAAAVSQAEEDPSEEQ